MRRILFGLAIITLLSFALTATAQPPGRGFGGRGPNEDVKKLEAEVKELKAQVAEMKAQLDAMKQGPGKTAQKGNEAEKGFMLLRLMGMPEIDAKGGLRLKIEGMPEAAGKGELRFRIEGQPDFKGEFRMKTVEKPKEEDRKTNPREAGTPDRRGSRDWEAPSPRDKATAEPDVTRQLDRMIRELEEIKKEVEKLKK